MLQIPTLELGETIRSYRKERGLRLEDLADDQISVSTISNIERGYSHVKEEKVQYLLQKLGIDFHQLNLLENKQKQKDDLIALEMKAVETLIASGNQRRAWDWLKKNRLPETHALAPKYHFVKGKYYVSLKEYEKSLVEFQEVLRLLKGTHVHHPLELECYREISQSLYSIGNFEQSLEMADKGLEWLQESEFHAKKTDAEITLAGIRSLSLIELKRMNEAYHYFSTFWKDLTIIRSSQLIIQLYIGKSQLSCSLGLKKEAVYLLEEAIKWCASNGEHELGCQCWMHLAKLYYEQEQQEFAEIGYQTVLALEEKLKDRSLILQAYLDFGEFFLQEERFEESKEKLDQAIFLAKRWNDDSSLIRAYLYLGDLSRKEQKLEQALQHYEQAKQLAQRTAVLEDQYLVVQRLAKIFKLMKNEQKFMCTLVEMFDLEQKVAQK